MKLIQSIMTNNPCYKANRKIVIKGLMLHSVGCPQPSAKVFINIFNKSNYRRACVHGFIDANTGDVYQTLPWNHRGWHAGGSANNTHIGVEMCEPSCIKYIQGSSFTCSNKEKAISDVKRTYESAVELFAKLCKENNLNPMTQIVSHKEGCKLGIASNHGDPEHLWKGLGLSYTMDTFRRDVKAKMDNTYVSGPIVSEKVEDKPITNTATFKVGDKVKIKQGAKTYEGKRLASFVYNRVHVVKSISGNRVVVTFNGVVIAGINKADLIKI